MVENVTWQSFQPRERRWSLLGQRPVIVWLTGLPGSGKTSIANVVDRRLSNESRHSLILDGDNLRHGLNRDLGFSTADRSENVRRTAETARLISESGLITIIALVSPIRAEREMARQIASDLPFLEVFIDTPLEICERRDPKGLYSLARAGKIGQFTGVSAPYERPLQPDLVVSTENISPDASAFSVIKAVMSISCLN
ncbi:adenylyl-sulfate kinase [Methylobacterium sp. WL7]|uniref:adenylyl-sulfate kinase n=1 Tax=Methylobacterium sp. WL7 TaxID=2603900 RepID=UPI001FEE6EDD|nr:adenylyl-sulfate kinase [Methylobacterium sp. WL7]